jgi:uncharacterized protein YgfB (UPF0149 family)
VAPVEMGISEMEVSMVEASENEAIGDMANMAKMLNKTFIMLCDSIQP